MNNDILDTKDKFLVKPQKTKISAGIAILIGVFLIGIGAFVFVRNAATEEMEQQIRIQEIEFEEKKAAEEEAKQRKEQELYIMKEQAIQDSLDGLSK